MVELSLENRPPPALPANSAEELKDLRKQVLELKRENEQVLRLNNRLIETQRSNMDTLPRIELLEEAIKALLQKGGVWTGKRLKSELRDPQNLQALNTVSMNEDNHLELFDKKLIMENPMKLNVLNKALHNLIDRGQIEESERGFRWKK